MTTCFVIGPIGNELAPLDSPERVAWESSLEIYERVIRAACDFLDIEAIRADQISLSGDITDQIFRHLYEADLVIADLTGANANVMYELGLRHSLHKLTIQVADSSTPLPFDVKAVRTILIQRTQIGLIEARKRLVTAIEMGLSNGADMVSATRVWESLRGASLGDLEVILGPPNPLEEDLDEQDDFGYVEIMLSLESSFEAVVTSLQGVGESIVSMNEETAGATAKLNSVPSDAPAARRLGALQEFANVLEDRATDLDSKTRTYRSDLTELDSRVTPLLRILSGDPQLLAAEGTDSFLDTITGLAQSARSAFEGFGGFASSVKNLGAMSSMLRKPSKSIVASIALLADSATTIDDWDAAVKRIRTSV